MEKKSTSHCNNLEEINEIIYQSKFTNLKNYTKFDWLLLTNDIYKIMVSCDLISFRYLIDNTLNLEAGDEENWRPIHYACRYGSIELVKLLIEKNVNLEVEDDENLRPIHYACRHGSVEIIKLLIEKNVNLEATDAKNWRPIHYACRYGSVEIIKLLIEKNVNLEAETVENGVQFMLHVDMDQ